MKIGFIGDVHAKWTALNSIINNSKSDMYIQVGDFGIGFGNNPSNLPDKLKFIPGNHDNQVECKDYSNYLGKFGYLSNLHAYFVGGALSTDKAKRIEGIDYWKDEEVNYHEANKIIDEYSKLKPKIVITHDCPSIQRVICLPKISQADHSKSFTVKLLNELYEIHKPEIWVHGHLHVNSINTINKTKFVGLGELDIFTIDLN